jgi:hypothetical protein
MTDLEMSVVGEKVYYETDEANVKEAGKEIGANVAAYLNLAPRLGTPPDGSSDDIFARIPLTKAEQSNT